MKNHYFKDKVVKMGVWSLAPGDCETWHGEHTSRYFKKLFGIPKESFLIYEFSTGLQHAYVSQRYLDMLHSQIDKINRKDFRGLSKKLKSFYPLLKEAKRIVTRRYGSPEELSNKGLVRNFIRIRDRIHHLAIFDQFTWLGEEYWTPKIENILINNLGLDKGSEEYNRVLFSLTKPEEISTTLLEKKEVLNSLLAIKNKHASIEQAGQKLAKQFGFLPVFCYGQPWQGHHYEEELRQSFGLSFKSLETQLLNLKKYKQFRNKELKETVKKYHITLKDLQVFLDFGLAIDTRNEAEYFVSFGSFYLLPLYKEIARRLYLSTLQVRYLTEKEMLDALLLRVDPVKILEKRKRYFGWGFSRDFIHRINFSSQESEKLFKYIEHYVKNIQGETEGWGVCASPGKATGAVRIVPSPEQNHKVKTGDILFTYATTTDYLPAMKRAAAIVTEVGGLTCHAAVVSREFNIPCIVALKNAMANFKDGELVEVDANMGTVKKI